MLLCMPTLCGKPDMFLRIPLEPTGFEANQYSGSLGKPSLLALGKEENGVRWLKQEIRRRIRGKRRQVPIAYQQYAAKQVMQQLRLQPAFRHAHHIALYMSVQEELSTERILRLALKYHKACYLPIITPTHQLQFRKVNQETLLVKNRLGIFEPQPGTKQIVASQLDLVLVPLLAFDSALHRLGMGGGYYDRTFAFKHGTNKPFLLGLGYEVQKVPHLPCSDLDISLDMVITEKRSYHPSH